MRVFVTGAKGFVGRHVAKVLAARGHRVIGLGHGAWVPAEQARWGVSNWLNGDVNMANLDALCAGDGLPDAVIHLAGGSSVGPSFAAPPEDFRRSVVSAAEVGEWLRLRAPTAPVVMVSSAAVYGAGHNGPIEADAVCTPYSPYGFHKRMAELALESYAKSFGVKVAIVRLFSVYGPGLRKQLLWDTCVRLGDGAQELTLGGSGAELRDWLHVVDAANLLVSAIGAASTGCPVFNGGTSMAVSVREIAEQLIQSWGGSRQVKFSGISRPGDPQALVAATCERELLEGWQPRKQWLQGIEEYVAWYKSYLITSGMEYL